jgi:hypothetical protein
VKIELTLTRAQVAALRRQLAEPDDALRSASSHTAKRKPRPMTEHRRAYMAEFMRRRRAAAKAA